MTKELRAIIEILSREWQGKKQILEVGSRAAKNQQEMAALRGLFPKAHYIGVDMQKGPGVDIVADATDLPFPDQQFDLTLCLETLEHAVDPGKVVQEIERVTKQQGIIVLSSQQNFPLHLHSADYFRFTPYGLASLLETKRQTLIFSLSPPFDREVELNPQHVIVIAWNGKTADKARLKRLLRAKFGQINLHKPYRHRLQDSWKYLKRAWNELWFRQALKFFE